MRERRRWAKVFNIPMNSEQPANFPPLTLNIMRHLAVLDSIHSGSNSSRGKGQERLIAALDALLHAFWVEHQETNKPEVLQSILRDILGNSDADQVGAMAATQEGKQILLKNTDKAFADGAFGLPWFVCTNKKGETEGFWGVDHLGQVATFLEIEKPQGRQGWTALL